MLVFVACSWRAPARGLWCPRARDVLVFVECSWRAPTRGVWCARARGVLVVCKIYTQYIYNAHTQYIHSTEDKCEHTDLRENAEPELSCVLKIIFAQSILRHFAS